jgi:DNA-binding MarR family transcriptional regulator
MNTESIRALCDQLASEVSSGEQAQLLASRIGALLARSHGDLADASRVDAAIGRATGWGPALAPAREVLRAVLSGFFYESRRVAVEKSSDIRLLPHLSESWVRVLGALDAGASRPKEIADRANMHISQASKVLRKMASHDAVVRIDPALPGQDKRAQQYELTAAGARLARQASEASNRTPVSRGAARKADGRTQSAADSAAQHPIPPPDSASARMPNGVRVGRPLHQAPVVVHEQLCEADLDLMALVAIREIVAEPRNARLGDM